MAHFLHQTHALSATMHSNILPQLYSVLFSRIHHTVDKIGGQAEFQAMDLQRYFIGKWGYSSVGRASRSQ